MNFSSFSVYLVLLYTISLNFLLSSATTSENPDSAYASTKMHIVYTENPQNEDPKAYHIEILASVLGRFVFS